MIYDICAHGAGYKIEADPASRVGTKLSQGIPYEHHLLEHIYEQHYLGLALDIGAHIGNHTLYFAAVCGLNVVAFEPIFHVELFDNVCLNPALHVRIEPYALGAEFGFAKTVQSQRAPVEAWGEVELAPVGRGALEVDVGGTYPVRALDDLDLSGVSVMKIDVEGMEALVLFGALDTISRERPVIFAEARDGEAHQSVAAILEPLGYHMTLGIKAATPMERWDP